MTIHTLCQYILFRMHSLGRHGTHSPFVYHFVEQVLRDKQGNRVATNTETLLAQLSAVYGLPIADTPIMPPCILLLPAGEPHTWTTLTAGYTSVLSQGFVALPSIHSSAQHTSHWRMASNLPAIAMSLDLYHTGLLLTRPEFKEKQHFMLR